MSYKIALCEDNKSILNELYKIVENYYIDHGIVIEIHKFENGATFLLACAKNDYNVIFMDIDLGEDNGVNIIEQLRCNNKNMSHVIFITSYSEYKQYVLSLHTFDYIVKPFSKSKVEHVLDELSQWISKEKNEKSSTISLKTTEGLVILDIDDILFFEYVNRKIDIITKHKKYAMYGSIKDLLIKLEPYDFVSPHAAYIVNFQHIHLLGKDCTIVMSNMKVIPLAQSRQKQFRKRYFDYIQ